MNYSNFHLFLDSEQRFLTFDNNFENITLVLFFDGASFVKTGKSGNIWAVYGMITDLGPILSCYFENIIQIFLIGKT